MAQISPQQMKNKNLDLQKSREKGKEPERVEWQQNFQQSNGSQKAVVYFQRKITINLEVGT